MSFLKFSLLLFIGLGFFTTNVFPRKSYGWGKAKSSYKPKAAYSGFGRRSSVNGRIKTKIVRGHFKPSNGYKFVNPYSRSRKK